MTAAKLLNCPFCGKPEPLLESYTNEHWVRCDGCDTTCASVYDAQSAIARWNTRTTPPAAPAESVTELCANHPNLREYIGHLEDARDSLSARLAALETQIAVMRDEEAQRVKMRAVQALIDKNQQDADAKSRSAMQSIGISTHWSYTAGKTVGAMTLELVEVVKKQCAEVERLRGGAGPRAGNS